MDKLEKLCSKIMDIEDLALADSMEKFDNALAYIFCRCERIIKKLSESGYTNLVVLINTTDDQSTAPVNSKSTSCKSLFGVSLRPHPEDFPDQELFSGIKAVDNELYAYAFPGTTYIFETKTFTVIERMQFK